MSPRIAFAIAALLAVAACAETREAAAPPPEPTAATAKKEVQAPLPGQLRVAGDAAGGLRLLSSLSRDGLPASSAFTGVDAGVRALCSGRADLVVVDRTLTDAEISSCAQAEISWTALSGAGEDAPPIYLRREISNAFRAASSAYD